MFCRNRNITTNTSTTASTSVDSTFSIEAFDHRRDVVGNLVADVGREEARQLLHLGLDRARGRQRVAGRRHQHREARGRLAVQARVELIAEAADLDPRDVAQAVRSSRPALARRMMAPNSSGRGELALDQHQRGDALVCRARFGTDAAGGDLRVLGGDRLVDVVGRQPIADQLGGIDPDAERTLGRIERGAADAGNAADFAEHVADHEVAEADFVEAAVGRVQRDDLQAPRWRLPRSRCPAGSPRAAAAPRRA